MLSKAVKDFISGLKLYYVWFYQAYHDITAKYKRTALGSFWLAGSMLVTSVSLAAVFGALFHQNLQQALPYTMAGILIYGMASYVFYDGTEMFMASGGIIKNHAYPYTFYAFHTTCKAVLIFFHNLIVYWLVAVAIGAGCVPNWSLLLAIPVVTIFMFTWGMLAGMLAARFRDMRFMFPYVAQLLSMITPIFWRADTLHGKARLLVTLNPFYPIIQIVREPLLGGMASAELWEYALIYTLVGIVLWAIFFPVYRRRIPFWV